MKAQCFGVWLQYIQILLQQKTNNLTETKKIYKLALKVKLHLDNYRIFVNETHLGLFKYADMEGAGSGLGRIR